MQLEYLITGTGRCGTVYCAKYLTAAGIPCGHEAVFGPNGLGVALKRLDGVEPIVLSEASQMRIHPNGNITRLSAYVDPEQIRADSSYLAAPFLDHERLKDTRVVHVVRNPVSVIQSFCYYLNYFQSHMPSPTNEITRRYESFIYTALPELMNSWLAPVERCALYYVRWNRLIQEKLSGRPHLFLNIEDASVKLGEYIGRPAPDVSKDENTFFKANAKPFSLADIPSKYVQSEVVVYAKELGYTL
jgi:hypothetical protein